MQTATLTDDTEMSARMRKQGEAVLALLPLIAQDPTEQAAALLVAAAVVIERAVGRDLAAPAMMALIEPSLAEWLSRRSDTTVN